MESQMAYVCGAARPEFQAAASRLIFVPFSHNDEHGPSIQALGGDIGSDPTHSILARGASMPLDWYR